MLCERNYIMKLVRWNEAGGVTAHTGELDPWLKGRLDLTALHGETEYIRQGFLLDVDGDGRPELITRTGNANRARAIRIDTGETVWISPDIAPPPSQSAQISQLEVGDLDEDGHPEVILATFHGDVICVNASDGSLKWHRRLKYHINNPTLRIARVTPGKGNNLVFVVGEDFDWITRHARPRINFVRKPNLLVLNADGSDALFVPEYAEHNCDSHDTWVFDVDDDGLCEVACCGDNRVIWFNHEGMRLFELPCKPEGNSSHAHPDFMLVADFFQDKPGKEIIYLNGTDGIIVADTEGSVLFDQAFPPDVASHLQQLMVLPNADGPFLLGANIRSRDSKLLCFDNAMNLAWAAQMENDMIGLRHADIDGDGQDEIITGSHGRDLLTPNAAEGCSLQVMKADGTPVHQHRWPDESECTVLAVGDVDADGRKEMVVSVGTHGGPEGRFSLVDGGSAALYVFGMHT
jgi:outer membrane protein assembly factor BamB